MERSSQVLQHGNPKIGFFFLKLEIEFWLLTESPCFRQYQSYISNWYINGKVFTSTTAWKPKNLNFFKEVRNWILSGLREKKSPWLRQYQSYISNWYILERSSKVLYHGNPKICIFFKFEIEFWLAPKSWNHLSFVNIGNWCINGKVSTSTTTRKPNFFFKIVRNWILTCAEELKSTFK